ncbi:MAG: hypothetical protein EOO41_01750 [Methanobacteriota archaeon]|nr:MAG: hypothetical protein EOO41_01750 [Euryarchaeota archaeon]
MDQENVYGSGFSSPVEDASGRCTPRLGATVSASQTRGTHSRPPLAAVRAHAVAHEWEVASHDMFTSHAPAQAGISITTSAQLAAASTAAGGSVSGGGSRDALRSGTRISIEAMNTTAPLAALPPPVVVEGVNSASATQRLARTAPRWHRRVALAV